MQTYHASGVYLIYMRPHAIYVSAYSRMREPSCLSQAMCVSSYFLCPRTSTAASASILHMPLHTIRQHTSANVSIRQHTSAEAPGGSIVHMCPHTSSMCPHTSSMCVLISLQLYVSS